MARLLAEGEALVQVGVMGLRAPDGSFTENVKLYKIVSSGEVNPKTGMTKGEEAVCEDIGAIFAAKMKQYIDGGGLMPQPITKGA
jgi:hypothetical protein